MLFCLLAGAGKAFPVFRKLALGSDALCSDVVLCAGPGRYCELVWKGNELHVVDVDGQSLVNSQPVRESARLVPGDVVQCGEERFTVSQSSNAKALLARDKMSRLVLECDRIRAKSDLSENQRLTLERNDREIGALELQIAALVQVVVGEEGDNREENVLQAPDSEMLDRTATDRSKRRTVQTYDSLLERMRELDEVIVKLQADLSEERVVGQDEAEEEDELDRFMAQNAQQLCGQDRVKQQRLLAEARAEREACEKLAVVAKPALLHFAPPAPIGKPGFRELPQELEKPHKKPKQEPIEDDEEYATTSVWQPPASQTGDGRSKLNLRFGY